eukprot:8854279-Pyramimonas_sp.AAC.1
MQQGSPGTPGCDWSLPLVLEHGRSVFLRAIAGSVSSPASADFPWVLASWRLAAGHLAAFCCSALML